MPRDSDCSSTRRLVDIRANLNARRVGIGENAKLPNEPYVCVIRNGSNRSFNSAECIGVEQLQVDTIFVKQPQPGIDRLCLIERDQRQRDGSQPGQAEFSGQ